MKVPKVVLLIFVSGKVVLTGKPPNSNIIKKSYEEVFSSSAIEAPMIRGAKNLHESVYARRTSGLHTGDREECNEKI